MAFSHPPACRVGMTEEEARAKWGDLVKVFKTTFTDIYYGVVDSGLSHLTFLAHVILFCYIWLTFIRDI